MAMGQATALADAATAVCTERRFRPVAVVVLDAAGHPVVTKRMDGCAPVGIPGFAHAKAHTCIAMRMSSRAFEAKMAPTAKAAQLATMVRVPTRTAVPSPGVAERTLRPRHRPPARRQSPNPDAPC